jgi:hypothetical protein
MPKENETASAEAEARGQAIEARARALAETWIAEGVFDDALSDETDAGHCAHMIANQALLKTLGFEMVPPELEDPIRPACREAHGVHQCLLRSLPKSSAADS